MGTDIHAAIEYKNGQWRAVTRPDSDFGKYEWARERTARVDFDRDYDLFAILGNVRNGRGFAGIPTGDGFEPMTEARGYPSDVTEEARAAMSEEHSATWVTLAEILAYDWTRTTRKQGYVNGAEFEKWDRMREWRPEPESYCSDVSGGMVRKVSNDEMRALVKLALPEDEHFKSLAHTYTLVQWTEAYATAAKQLWEKALPDMLKLGTKYGHENVRLVMDFDS